MICKPIGRTEDLIWKIASVLFLVFGYWLLSSYQHQINPKDTTIPNFFQLWSGCKTLFTSDAVGEIWLWNDIKATYGRHFLGLFCGSIAAVILGIAMGCYQRLEAFCLPSLNFFAKVPATAMLAVYFVLFGTEVRMFIAIIALGIFPLLTQTVFQSVKKDVTEHAISKAYTLGASSAEVVWNIIFQQILPRVIEAIRLQIGPAMIFLIAAEWMVADVGFGYRLRIQSRLLNMNIVYIYLAVLGVSGFIMDWGISRLRQRLCPWFGD